MLHGYLHQVSISLCAWLSWSSVSWRQSSLPMSSITALWSIRRFQTGLELLSLNILPTSSATTGLKMFAPLKKRRKINLRVQMAAQVHGSPSQPAQHPTGTKTTMEVISQVIKLTSDYVLPTAVSYWPEPREYEWIQFVATILRIYICEA